MNDPFARGGVRRYLDTVAPEEYVPNFGEINPQDLSLTGLADLYGSDKGRIKHNYTKHYQQIIDDLCRLEGVPRQDCMFEIAEAEAAIFLLHRDAVDLPGERGACHPQPHEIGQ